MSDARAFDAAVAGAGFPDGLRPGRLGILQLHVGKRCNLRCHHCHVDAGPHRTEKMSKATLEDVVALVDRLQARNDDHVRLHTVDLTGGAPELHPEFRWIVSEFRGRGLHVIDRCNLALLLLAAFADLPEFLAHNGVEVVASLPHWRAPNTDAQRGDGAFEKSIAGLKRLNDAGYGKGDPARRLTLMHNPAGAFLSSGRAAMEREWKAGLARTQGVSFDGLLMLNNMPIARFLDSLTARGDAERYRTMLAAQFNPAAVPGLMCRDTWNVGCDGTLYDCDFNGVLGVPMRRTDGSTVTVADADADDLAGRRIGTGAHCFGCTAGAGSGCGGATT